MVRLPLFFCTLLVVLGLTSNTHAKDINVINGVLDSLISAQVNEKDIHGIFNRTFRNFSYVSDRPGEDMWIDYSYRVKKNRKFYGDCDDFAVTLHTLLYEQGYRPRLYIVYIPELSSYHAVIRVNNLLLDNRQDTVKHWNHVHLEYTNVVPYPDQVWLKKVIRIISP